MGGKSSGGQSFQIPGTQLAQPWHPNMRTNGGGAVSGGPSGRLRQSSGNASNSGSFNGPVPVATGNSRYDSLNQAIARSMATQAAKGFGTVAGLGMVAPNTFTPMAALGEAGRRGYNEWKTIQGEMDPPWNSNVRAINADKKKHTFGSLLDDEDGHSGSMLGGMADRTSSPGGMGGL